MITNTVQQQYETQPHPKSQLGWLKILAITAGGILFLTIVLRLLTPPVEPIPTSDITTTNITGDTSKFSGIVFIGTKPEKLPEKLAVFRANNNTTLVSKIKNQLIEDYELLKHPLTDQIYQNTQYQLVDDPNTNQITLNATVETSSPATFDVDEMIAIAQEFFTSREIIVNPDKSNVRFFESITEVSPSTNGSANIIQIPFFQSVNGYPIFFSNVGSHPFVVRITNTSQILMVTISPQLLTLSGGQEYTLLTIDEAVEQINSKQRGAFVSIYSKNEGDAFDPTTITSGELSSVSVEYRFDPETNYVLPYYRFEGTYVGSSGTTLEGELITPAVVTKQLEKP